jgi:glycine betaine/proline transport system permease protein
MDNLYTFPSMDPQALRDLKKSIDSGFLEFSRTYGEAIEIFFEPLLFTLVWLEKLLIESPWPITVLVLTGLAWITSRSWLATLFSATAFLIIGYLGMWPDTMATLAIISVATLLCIVFGIPVGIWISHSQRAKFFVTPILDVMQTIPSFVYLIPVVMLLGIGKVPGLIAVCIYATPPLALPSIFAGVNQTIMMSLSMVVIASMIGVKGLGLPVLRAISNQYLALGLMNGLAIVALAIIFDRIAQLYGKRLQSYKETTENE